MVAKLRMAFTEGNTNREYSFFWGGMVGFGWMDGWMDGREQKVGGGDVRAKASSWNGEWNKAKNDCKGTVLLQSKPQNASSGWGAVFLCDLAHAASGIKKTKASAHGSVDGGKDYSSIIC